MSGRIRLRPLLPTACWTDRRPRRNKGSKPGALTRCLRNYRYRSGAAASRRPLSDLCRAAARKSDGARRRHLGAAQYRSDIVVSFRLPGRRVRLLRHDGEWQAALDLPHPYLQGRGRREIGDRAVGQSAGHQGLGDRHATFFEKWQKAQGRVRAEQDKARRNRANPPRQPGAALSRRGDRMHQLRRLLRRLRYGALEPGLSRPGGADAGVDAPQRRTRCRRHRAAASGGGGRRLPFLSLAPVLPGALPAGAQSHRRHRRPQAAHHGGVSRRARSRHDHAALSVAAGDGGADGTARARPHRRHLLCLRATA